MMVFEKSGHAIAHATDRPMSLSLMQRLRIEPSRGIRRLLSLYLCLLLTGCAAFNSRYDGQYEGPAVYGGVYTNLWKIHDSLRELDFRGLIVAAIDLPLSAIIDSAFLPWTAQEQWRQLPAIGPSVVSPIEGTHIKTTAMALFQRCIQLQAEHDTQALDCYADEASVERVKRYTDGQKQIDRWQGKAYRRVLARKLAIASDDIIEYRNIQAVKEGQRIRIKAIRLVTSSNYHSPYQSLLGPDQHGQWRILMESFETRP